MSKVEALGTSDVTLPVNVYCSLVRCALQNSTLGFQSSLLNPLNGAHTGAGSTGFNTVPSAGNKMEGLSSTIDCLMKLSNAEAERLDSTAMPMPPRLKRGQLEGELKDSLDRVKSELFEHYSFYYNLQEYDIPTRLQMLSVHSAESRECGCGANCVCHHAKCSDPSCNAYHGCKTTKDTIGSSNVMEMLDGLKHKFETINERINLLETELENEVCDPNIREYHYSTETKRVMGFDDMDDLDNMREHIHNLYSHLYHQSKLNQKKIEVLQNKLLTLTAHTRLANQRQPNDKRNGL